MKIDEKSIRSIQYLDRTGLELYHYHSLYQLQIEDNSTIEVSGFGTAETKELALTKSVYELFERIVFRCTPKKMKYQTSNGFAAHTNPESAQVNSVLELIERDCFFNMWLKKEPPQWLLGNEEMLRETGYADLLSCCEDMGVSLHIGLGLISEYAVVVVGSVVDTKGRFGGFVTSACNITATGAVDSVVCTLARYITIVKNRIAQQQPIYSRTEIPVQPVDHFEYYLNPNRINGLKWFLDKGNPQPWCQSYKNIEVNIIEHDVKFPIKCSVALAQSPDLQGYFTGESTEEKIHPKFRAKLQTLNQEIHPLP